MTFKDILNSADEKSVIKILSTEYEQSEDDLEGYSHLLADLRAMTPSPTDFKIRIQHVVSFDGWEYEGVSGVAPITNEQKGLSLTKREEWLGMEITEDTLASYTPDEILAHCLWEMTFYGFSQTDVDQMKDYLDNICPDDLSELDLLALEAEDKPQREIVVDGVTYTSADVKKLLGQINQYEKK